MKKTSFFYLSIVILVLVTGIYGGFSPLLMTVRADASPYPSHEVKLIVASGVGGTLDLQGRALQKEFAKYMQQPLTVFNRPGGGGRVGMNEVVQSAPDGYTLGISSIELIFHSIYGTSEYHYMTALDPLAQISSTPILLVVNAESPWNTVAEMVQDGKNHPLKFSHSGVGSITHILGEAFAKATDTKTVQVPFHGGNEKAAMLLGRHVDAAFISSPAVKEHIKAGKLRVLATTGTKRMKDPFFANVPTLKELGIDIEFLNWAGVVSHKPLSPEVKASLVSNLKKMIEEPEFQKTVESFGVEIEYLSPEQCQEKWIHEARNLKKMVTEAGLLEQVKTMQSAK